MKGIERIRKEYETASGKKLELSEKLKRLKKQSLIIFISSG
jgi:hypothetical protein